MENECQELERRSEPITTRINSKTSDGDPRQKVLRMIDVQGSRPNLDKTVLRYSSTASADNVLEKISSIAKSIHNAKKHVRGSKTSDFLKQTTEMIDSLLIDLNVNPASLYNRTIYEPKHVCPEKYMGTTFGYPYFYKGFETTNCEHGVAVWKLVTVIKHVEIFKRNSVSTLKETEQLLSSVYKMNSNFSVILSASNAEYFSDIKRLYPMLSVIDSKGLAEGSALNQIVSTVKTPYVFLARNIQFFTNDSRLERLIREIETLGVKVAAGAVRNADGQWKKGCFQSMYRNYTLKYLEGYDESLHECLFCDYVQGPFVTSKKYLEKNEFENLNETEGLFEEWFLRMTHKSDEAITCPDSMFHVKWINSQKYGMLKEFMQKWDLFKIVTPNGSTVTRTCENQSYQSHNTKSLSPCSAQFNADAVKMILRTCEEAGLFCELQEGTALGAVKLGKTLPWERDADITFLTANYSGFQNLKSVFKKAGFGFSDLGATWCCVDNRTAGGKFKMSYKSWNLELYGQHMMDSELLTEKGIKPTKVFLDGQWVNVPRNPGLFVRNRYGREIYQHAEHWMSTGGSSGWINYKTNMFKRCSNEGDHDCLDRYNADGDLPFIEMLP
ncbi:uncharacterized protein LOC123556602 isoform X2 [Mercenaria mercenaria]|uniref:uncharacterized protein LOC123556602 isoform X2 n=1 Tax=Mercenaria mercenaria TaxID=6596 RepID=UPI001E1D8FBB|nr:uncharacterized protein LOC123556602 isoform X2 [Mercenaria mercenaria]XP_045203384.1 uncharacterized protein LOC123556602 isoform X2 [Mercenaria mercenaria]XP_045203385.1 uncharacterized protein LOC123556602 isoform X2 [Mercenaria mercenaria]XP_053398846.1 uncharacterized protein LOC123556602 isoform X2 [Mercenaria mercenaria]